MYLYRPENPSKWTWTFFVDSLYPVVLWFQLRKIKRPQQFIGDINKEQYQRNAILLSWALLLSHQKPSLSLVILLSLGWLGVPREMWLRGVLLYLGDRGGHHWLEVGEVESDRSGEANITWLFSGERFPTSALRVLPRTGRDEMTVITMIMMMSECDGSVVLQPG